MIALKGEHQGAGKSRIQDSGFRTDKTNEHVLTDSM
jgi:hypothetical protein